MKRKVKFFIVVFIILCSICFVTITNARYASNVNMNGNVDVAIPKIVLNTSNISSTSTMLPGETVTYEFDVQNYEDSKINEVQMNYYININSVKNELPITYKLYAINGTSETELTQTTSGFGPITLNYGKKQTTSFKLVYTWDEKSDDVSYANKGYSFNISVDINDVYTKHIESNTIFINSQEYTPITATSKDVDDIDNTLDITIENNNSYGINIKAMEENDLFDVTYDGVTADYITVDAKSTKTVRVTLKARSGQKYENAKNDASGNSYTNINIYVKVIKPYNAEKNQVATDKLVYIDKTVKNHIIANAGDITDYEDGHQFTGISSSGEGGLCSIEDPVSGEKIYFFRGDGSKINNYVSFAGYTWRILRINADGSLRLILDGTISNSQYQTSNAPTTHTIAKAIELIDWKSSTVYSTLHTWYNNNIATNTQYSDKIVTTQYVFDTSYSEKTATSTSASVYYFGPYLRVGVDGNQYSPTFSYTDESLVEDTIGIITADELLYAGGYFNKDNTSFFLYNSSITTDCWTMSPSFWDNSAHYKAGMLIMSSSGKIHDWPDGGNTLTASLGLRPVISIKGDVEMQGDGTSSSPYEFKN